MRLSPLAAVAAIAAAGLLTLTACGGDDGSDEKSSAESSPSSSEAGDATGSDGSDDDGRSRHPKKICKALNGGDVAEALGVDGMKRGPIVQNSCTYADPTPQSMVSVGVNYLQLDAVGGAEAVESGLAAAAGGEPKEVPDLGDAAYVVTQEVDESARAFASIVIDDSLVQLTVIPGPETSPDDAEQTVVGLLELVDASL